MTRRGNDLAVAYGVVHGLAACRDCDWSTGCSKNAQANAAKHARTSTHHVNVELSITFSYSGATTAPKKATR